MSPSMLFLVGVVLVVTSLARRYNRVAEGRRRGLLQPELEAQGLPFVLVNAATWLAGLGCVVAAAWAVLAGWLS